MSTPPTVLGQRSLDDLGTPLDEVTFCVVDVETTGGTAATGALTEIGAVKLRGGRCEGTFQSLIDPGVPIPREITVLTGISAATVADAPPARAVLPAFHAFLGDAVVVGHNVRYDLGFLDAESARCGLPRIANVRLDTLALARRLVRDEVPNCKLGTLAAVLRLDHRPSHRALDDALATGDLLHHLIERAARWGVLGLDDLVALPKLAGHPQAAKLRLTESLPRAPGVYSFLDRSGRVLYVGKATDLRARVRSYFSGDDRRKVGALLRETDRIEHQVCHHPLEAGVREIRLIHEHEPRFNRHGTTWRAAAYLRLTDEPFPRLAAVRTDPGPDAVFLGPLRSTSAARRVAEAIESVVKLRRCTHRVPRDVHRAPPAAPTLELGLDAPPLQDPRPSRCAAAQLGVATCPCSGEISVADYASLVDQVAAGLGPDPEVLLGPLRDRIHRQAAEERFEDAALTRDRAAALADALIRQRRLTLWRAAARVVLEMPDGSGADIRHGVLHAAWGPDDPAPTTPSSIIGPLNADLAARLATAGRPDPDALGVRRSPLAPVPRHLVDEVLCIASTVERSAGSIRIRHVEGTLASPRPAIERFAARSPRERHR